MTPPAPPAGNATPILPHAPIAGPLRVSAAAAGRTRSREHPAGIAMSALAAGESVLSGLRMATSSAGSAHGFPGEASVLALSDGTRISFTRITGDSVLEPA